MNTLLWAGLALNALAHLRMAVLDVQDGEDRVQAGLNQPSEVLCWQKGGYGKTAVLIRTLVAPLSTIFLVGQFLLFPRGIKSKFAKEQEVKAKADACAAVAAELQQETLRQLAEAEALIQIWTPGEFLTAPAKPEQVALGWHAAADAFDAASDLVARTAGQPWSPAPSARRTRIKATVHSGPEWNESEMREEERQ